MNIKSKKDDNKLILEKFYWIKPTSFDEVKPFNFKQAPWSITVIFLFSVVIIPTILSLVGTYVLARDQPKLDFYLYKSQPKIIFLMVLVALLGFFVSMKIDKEFMIRSGAWIAYSIYFIEIIIWVILIFFSSFGIFSKIDKSENINLMVVLMVVILMLSTSFFLICTNQEVRKRIIYTFKEKKLTILKVTVFYCIAAIITIILLDKIISYFINYTRISKNQVELEKLKATPWGFFALVLLSCVAAPISEEFTCRFGIFTICRTPWLGFIVATFNFAAMHVIKNGDWENIVNYLPFSFILSLLYINTRGNIVYPFFLHLLLNLIVI